MTTESPHSPSSATAPTPRDAVDAMVQQWRAERPDVDPSPMLVLGRLSRLNHALEPRLRPVYESVGLREGEFDLLATLRRRGRPYRMSPGELSTALLVTSGAISKRVDKLELMGLVTRAQRGTDARTRQITLTDAGIALVDECLTERTASEDRLLAGLEPEERDQLAGLLRKWLGSLTPPGEDAPGTAQQ